MSKLTEFEKEMHVKLCELGDIKWSETTHTQTRALNRLVNKGFATYEGHPGMKWLPVEEER
jgi:hypothetical protein